MPTGRILRLFCFIGIIATTPLVLADGHRAAAASSRPAMARPAPRVAPSFRGAPGRNFQRINGNLNRGSVGNWNRPTSTWARPGNWNGAGATWNRSVVRSNQSTANLNRSTSNFNRAWNRSTARWNRPGANLNRSTANLNRWDRRVGNSNRGNGDWWRRHCHNRFVFIGAFGFPWYYPFSFYGYYPYSYYDPYGYDPYGYYPYSYDPYMYPARSTVYQGVPTSPDDGAYNDTGPYDDQSGYTDGDRSGRSLIAQVQQQLADDGYYKGRIDGVTGSRTYYAIRAYQRDHHLRVDGRISDELLSDMGLR